jgi:integrase
MSRYRPPPRSSRCICRTQQDAQGCVDRAPDRRYRVLPRASRAPKPDGAPDREECLEGVRREIGIAQKGKSALTIDGLRPVVATFGDRRIDVRDRAILLLGFAAAMRRSEIVALDVGDLTFAPKASR